MKIMKKNSFMRKCVSHKQRTLLRDKTPALAIFIFLGIFVSILHHKQKTKSKCKNYENIRLLLSGNSCNWKEYVTENLCNSYYGNISDQRKP